MNDEGRSRPDRSQAPADHKGDTTPRSTGSGIIDGPPPPESHGNRVKIRSALVWVPLSGILLMSLGCDSHPKAIRGIWADLPREIRQHIHVNVDLAPRFPEEVPSSLRPVHRWPRIRRFEGNDYHVEFSAHLYDEVLRRLPSPDRIPLGSQGFGAEYVREVDGKPITRGPRTYWSSESLLVERSYTTSSLRQTWTYDGRGRIIAYSRSATPPDRSRLSCSSRPLPTLEEHFNEDGYLVGFTIAVDRDRLRHYWMGTRVSPERFRWAALSANPWQLARGVKPESRTSPRGDWSRVRPEHRPRIHTHVDSLPSPSEVLPRSINDLARARWIHCRKAFLRVTRKHGGRFWTGYEFRGAQGTPVGPWYSWRSDSTLSRSGHGTEQYSFDRLRRIHEYTSRRDRSAETLFFDGEGRLLAAHIEDHGQTCWYWLGEEMPMYEVVTMVQNFGGYNVQVRSEASGTSSSPAPSPPPPPRPGT
jgi:hypothetical protein